MVVSIGWRLAANLKSVLFGSHLPLPPSTPAPESPDCDSNAPCSAAPAQPMLVRGDATGWQRNSSPLQLTANWRRHDSAVTRLNRDVRDLEAMGALHDDTAC